jgi:hypothetical protein
MNQVVIFFVPTGATRRDFEDALGKHLPSLNLTGTWPEAYKEIAAKHEKDDAALWTWFIPNPRERPMKRNLPIPSGETYEFHLAEHQTAIQVVATKEKVIIRASRDRVPTERKISFIRELAAEGFIDTSYRFFGGFEDGIFPIEWIIDESWLKPGNAARARTNRIMIGSLAVACVLWITMITAAFVSSR